MTAWRCRGLGKSLQQKRSILEKQLVDIGFRVLPAQGTYFLVADFRWGVRAAVHLGTISQCTSGWHGLTSGCGCSPLLPPGSTEDDVAFCKRLTIEAGVTPIPVGAQAYATQSDHDLSVVCVGHVCILNVTNKLHGKLQVSSLYASNEAPRNLVRLCFCKTDEKLFKACQSLEAYFGSAKK